LQSFARYSHPHSLFYTVNYAHPRRESIAIYDVTREIRFTSSAAHVVTDMFRCMRIS